jgi:hypothetical protein
MKQKLLRISNIAGIVWVGCMVFVIGIIAIASKFMTHDPDFSAGDPEHVYLLPMLSFFFVGGISFGVMVLSGVASFFVKGKWKPYIPFKYIFIVVAFILFGLGSFIFAFRQQNLASWNSATFTSDDVFAKINDYRVSKGLQPVKLEPQLCDNLVARYLSLKKDPNNGHLGFEEWVKGEELEAYAPMAELYAITNTADEAITFWDKSQGHRSTLIDKYDVGCVYANEGISVVILGTKPQPTR